jgi:hypothetical protein
MRCTPTIHELIVLTLPPRHWHLNYFAVSGNHPSMWWFCNQVRLLWLRTLRRRSQKAHLSWERFISLVDRFFPPIKTLHPLPCHRFDAKTRGRSPVR